MGWTIKDDEDLILESGEGRVFTNKNSEVKTQQRKNEECNCFLVENIRLG